MTEIENYIKKVVNDCLDFSIKLIKQTSPSPQESLYHYTSFNNFERIIKTQELCFTDYRCLNDPTEILFSERILQETIKEESSSLEFEYFWEKCQNIVSCFINKENFSKNRDLLPQIEKIETDFFTFSFCSKRDYLPMWRWYSNNGTGISLGFRKEYFFQQEIKDKKPIPFYAKIIYGKDFLSQVISDLLKYVEKKIDDFLKLSPSEKDKNNFFIEVAIKAFSANILPFLPRIKHCAYKEEEEHRLYYQEHKATFLPKSKKEPDYFPFDPIPEDRRGTRPRKQSQNGICLSSSTNQETRFVKSDKFSFDDITEIWVGPCLDFKCVKEKVEKLLIEQGYNPLKIGSEEGIIIKKSDAPYQ